MMILLFEESDVLYFVLLGWALVSSNSLGIHGERILKRCSIDA
jgi:hypothetical protein